MGKVFSMASRSVKMYNIENRAHKIISQSKPKAAPKHKANVIEMEQLIQNHPESFEELLKKDTKLDKYLKDVYVQSNDTPNPITVNNSSRLLPLRRQIIEAPEYGYYESDQLPRGKISLRLLLKFLADYQNDAIVNNPTKIALDYSLPEESVRNVIKYFRVFEVYLPEKPGIKTGFVGPSLPRIKSRKIELPRISSSSRSNDKS